jgi:multiple sugar transport system permease protein
MISTSLKARGALTSIPIVWIPKEPTLAAYEKVLTMFPFLKTVANSLFISVSYTVITLISASMPPLPSPKSASPKRICC